MEKKILLQVAHSGTGKTKTKQYTPQNRVMHTSYTINKKENVQKEGESVTAGGCSLLVLPGLLRVAPAGRGVPAAVPAGAGLLAGRRRACFSSRGAGLPRVPRGDEALGVLDRSTPLQG